MKTLRLTLLAFLTATTLFAATPFTSASDGYDWKTAPAVYKMEYCDLMAKANQKLAPGISAEFIYDSLSTFYNTSKSGLLRQRIVQMVALTVAAYVNTKQQ